MSGIPNILLLGYGVHDSLQLTVETQQLLARYGSAYTIGLPPALARYLKSLRVNVTDLADRMEPGRSFVDAYLDIANFLLERTASELPVVLLCPGNPLATNAIARYLAMAGPRHGLIVQAVPGVSQLDLIISAIGLDVSTFGLQVFDATRLVERGQAPNAAVPLIVLNAGGFGMAQVPGDASAPQLAPLAHSLGNIYPAGHPIVVVNVEVSPPGIALAHTTVEGLAVGGGIQQGGHLFIDAVRTSA